MIPGVKYTCSRLKLSFNVSTRKTRGCQGVKGKTRPTRYIEKKFDISRYRNLRSDIQHGCLVLLAEVLIQGAVRHAQLTILLTRTATRPKYLQASMRELVLRNKSISRLCCIRVFRQILPRVDTILLQQLIRPHISAYFGRVFCVPKGLMVSRRPFFSGASSPILALTLK